MGTSGNVIERPLAQKGRSSTVFNNLKNLESSSFQLRLENERTWRVWRRKTTFVDVEESGQLLGMKREALVSRKALRISEKLSVGID